MCLGLPNDLSLYWQRYPFAQSEIICKLRAFIAEMYLTFHSFKRSNLNQC